MEITANAVQLVTANNNVIFTDTVVPGSPAIMHRDGSGLVKLRGITNCQCRARFKVFFNGNIAIPTTGAVGAISLAISVDGEPVGEGTMTITPTAVNAFGNVSAMVNIDVPAGCCASIGIRNISGQTISVQNANLIVERVA